MTTTTPSPGPIATALHHLIVAAARAETDAHRDRVTPAPFSPWVFLAADIRLVADTVDPTTPWLVPTPPGRDTGLPEVLDSLHHATAALELTVGDPHALELLWHVHELIAATHQVHTLVDLQQANAGTSLPATPVSGDRR